MLFVEGIVLKNPYLTFFASSYPLILFLTVYWTLRSIRSRQMLLWGIACAIMIVAVAQAFLGLMQLYSFEASHHGLFAITGSFHNPGPFSGFVVCALPIALSVSSQQLSEKEFKVLSSRFKVGEKLFSTSNLEQSPIKKFRVSRLELRYGLGLGFGYLIKVLGWLTLVLILLVLTPAQSRAAWIAGVVGCSYVLANHPKVKDFRKKLRTSFLAVRKPLRIIILSLAIAILIAAAYGLYTMKKGSADARLLIWQVTTELIKEKPLLGHGVCSFDARYMDAQAEWFSSGKGTSVQGMVAGSPEAPFNELLKLWLERGLIAVLLVAVLLCFVFVPAKQSSSKEQSELINSFLLTAFKGALITLLVFGLFSYPFDLSPFVLILTALLAVFAHFSKTVLNISSQYLRWSVLPIFFLLIGSTLYIYPQRKEYYQALSVWQEAKQLYNYRTYNTSVKAYKEAYPVLKNNGLFLQMYGKALSMDEQYLKSNEILAEAKHYTNSHIIQNTLGDNYKALGDYVKAEAAYIKSSEMIPSLLLPKYLLAKLYNDSDQEHKAKQIAEEILNCEVKVESSATREIMNEMKKISEQ